MAEGDDSVIKGFPDDGAPQIRLPEVLERGDGFRGADPSGGDNPHARNCGTHLVHSRNIAP